MTRRIEHIKLKLIRHQETEISMKNDIAFDNSVNRGQRVL